MSNTRWSQIVGKDVKAQTSEEAIKLAGLDWKVLQSNVKYLAGGQDLIDTDHMVNYRSDNSKMLGIVGDGYQVLQNSAMFQFLDGVVGSSEAMFTNAGAFKDGRKVYIQAQVPGYIHFDDGDDVGEKFLTFISSHDGSIGCSVMFTPVRIVCQNTLVRALKSDDHRTSIRHTISMADRLIEAKAALALVNGQVSLLEKLSRQLIAKPFKDKQMTEFLEKSRLISQEEKKSTRAQNVIDEVLRLFHHGKGSEYKSSKGTAWGAYNAVTEYVDHYRGSNDEKRAEASLLGWGAKVKENALELLAA